MKLQVITYIVRRVDSVWKFSTKMFVLSENSLRDSLSTQHTRISSLKVSSLFGKFPYFEDSRYNGDLLLNGNHSSIEQD